MGFASRPASGQVVGQPGGSSRISYPSETYYAALEIYRAGELPEAIDAFEAALSQCRRDRNGRWIDAIPVRAMLAECHYEAGNLRFAHENLDAVLQLAIRHAGWLNQLEWDNNQNAAVRQPKRQATWWSGPPLRPAPTSNRVKIAMTTLDASQIVQSGSTTGNIMAQQRLMPIDAVEILRGLAIALYRRGQLLGPLAADEPLLKRAEQSLTTTHASAGPVAVATIRSVQRLASIADGKGAQAGQSAVGVAMLAGNHVHPLSPVLLCGAARVMAQSESPQAAFPLAMRASAAAVAVDQPEWVAEAFRIAVGVAPADGAGSLYQATTTAANAYARDSRMASAQLHAVAVEAAMGGGGAGEAATAMEQAKALLQRRSVQLPRTEAYANYVSAKLSAAAGNRQATMSALQQLFGFTLGRNGQPSVPRVYQLRLIERATRASALGGKTVDSLMSDYLGSPPDGVWRTDPVDALGYLAADQTEAFFGWVRAAAVRGSAEDTLVRGDRLVGQRFLTALPLAGRILQARWIAAADERLLSEQALALRKNGPATLKRLRQTLAGPPLDDPAAVRERSELTENLAMQIALERVDLPTTFPAKFAGASDLAAVPAGTAVLTFIPSGDNLLGVLAVDGKLRMWPVPAARTLGAQIGRLLQQAGIGRRRGSNPALQDESGWREAAVALRERVIPSLDGISEADRLIVVPSGPLWYLPFNMLPSDEATADLLGETMQVRYAPTVGLAMHPLPLPSEGRPIGFHAGLFFAPRDGERNSELVESIKASVEDLIELPGESSVPGRWVGLVAEHVVSATAVTPATPPAPLAWDPLGYDAGMPGSLMEDWMRFPWKPPQTVVLAGMRTAATKTGVGSGDELFFNALAMQASGVPHFICSRWPVGGESTAVLLREFLQELPFSGLDAAWERALLMLRDTELDPAGEPLLTAEDEKLETLTGRPPLFWAGYLVFSGIESTDK